MPYSEALAGQLTEGEQRYFRSLSNTFEMMLRGQDTFVVLLQRLDEELRRLVREFGFDLDAAYAAGFESTLDAITSRPQVDNGDPLSPVEIDFVRDMQGLVEFAGRNGLDPNRVLQMLFHDASGLVHQFCCDTSVMLKNCFRPMSAGWWKRNAQPVGEPGE